MQPPGSSSPSAASGAPGASGQVAGSPAPGTVPAQPPPNPAHQVAQGLKTMAADAGSVAAVAGALASPERFITGKIAGALDEGLASMTNSLSAVLPSFPAATITSLALGAPHAHVAHPPSGPPPVPPTPLPPMGPVMLGTCMQVLINGKPAARCGDIGLNPTCCGLPPMFEILTGSSKIFIGGARAARAGIDITMHCKPSAGGSRAGAMAAKAAAKASLMAKIASVAGKVASVAGKVSQVAAIAGQVADAEAAAADDDAAMAAAAGLNAAMMAAQMAADAAAMAAGAAMGKDPCVPPTGTPGMILMGSPNVLIGGVPLPSSMAIAQGLMKKLKGLKFRPPGGGRSGRGAAGVNHPPA